MSEFFVVGLGNPGDEYEHTRHNAGFDALDEVARDIGVSYWKRECGALVGRGIYHDVSLVLAKPQSYMNTSGGPVKRLLDTYGGSCEQLIVIHDDLDIEPGHIRIKFGGGHAGHNGLRSICEKLMTRDWFRIRCGIGHPLGRMDTADYVLSRPKGQAADDFSYTVSRAAAATLFLVEHGLEETQQEFNG